LRVAAPQILGKAQRLAYQLADVVTVPSADAAQKVQASMEIPPERIVILPRGVDQTIFRRDMEEGETNPYEAMVYKSTQTQWYRPDEQGNPPKVVLYTGRVANEKQYQELLALGQSEEFKAKNYHLVIAGPFADDEIKSHVLDVANQQASHVHYVGSKSQKELARLYRHANVFFSPSMSETHGHTVNEALVSGLPVVVPKDQETARRVVEGVTGQTYTSSNGKISELNILELFHAIQNAMRLKSLPTETFDAAVNQYVIGWEASVDVLLHIVYDTTFRRQDRRRIYRIR